MVKRLRRLALVLLVLIAQATVLRADYKESYRKGIAAYDRKEWGEMARWMRQAAGEQSQEGEQVKLYGVRFEAYLPHYYLGLALFQTGDCEGALAQWQDSERQGAIQGTNQNKTLVQLRDTCRQRLASSKPPPAPTPAPPSGPDPAVLARATREAETEIQKAADAQAQIAQRRNNPDFAEAWKQESAQAGETQATEQLGTARSRLDRGKGQKQVSDLQEAERLASQARQSFESLLGRLDRRQVQIRQTRDKETADKLAEETRRQQQEAAKAEAARLAAAQQEAENQEKARRQDLGRQIDRASADARKILDQASRVANPPAELKGQQSAVRDLLRRAGAVSPTAPLADLDRLQKEIPAATSRLQDALLRAQGETSGPPAELRAAARAFLRGDYQEVVRTLASATFQDRKATLSGNLLLAAARYSLYLQAGEKDAKLREQALENVLSCRRIDPKLVPDPRAFSPRFSEFFKAAS